MRESLSRVLTKVGRTHLEYGTVDHTGPSYVPHLDAGAMTAAGTAVESSPCSQFPTGSSQSRLLQPERSTPNPRQGLCGDCCS